MKQRRQAIRELALEAMANDYENFSCILQDVWMRGPEFGVAGISRAEIVTALTEIIEQGYAKAYALSAGPPANAEERDYSAENIENLWFYVTPSGKALVKELEDTEESSRE